MSTNLSNDRGSALVVALLFILGLTLTAAIVVRIAGGEKHVAFNDYTHTRAFYSSDAGGEEAINWIRTRRVAPTPDAQSKVRNQGSYTDLVVAGSTEENKYKNSITYDGRRYRPGWSREYVDYDYTITSDGASVQQSSTVVEVQASRLFRQGY